MSAPVVCQTILELDMNIQPICRKASAEIFCIWRQIINIKTTANTVSHQMHLSVAKRSALVFEKIDLSVVSVSKFSESFQPFFTQCLTKFHCLSTRPRISLGKKIPPTNPFLQLFPQPHQYISDPYVLVSLSMFWNLGIFLLVDIFKHVTKGLDPSIQQEQGLIVREYQRNAVSCVAQVVECVIALPADEAFNLQNGLGAEVPLTAYHVTPGFAVTTLQRAIENVIDLQLTSQCDAAASAEDAGNLIPDGIWDPQIDILLKGLISLDVTIGGSQACGVAIETLMHKYGDVISECWTSGFDS